VEDSDASTPEVIGNQCAVAAPPEGFGAHDRHADRRGGEHQSINLGAEGRRLHVVRVPTKRRVAPGGVPRVRLRGPSTTQTGIGAVLHAVFKERLPEWLLVELGVPPRHGEATNVGEIGNLVRSQESQEFSDWERRMPNGPDCRAGSVCTHYGQIVREAYHLKAWRPVMHWIARRSVVPAPLVAFPLMALALTFRAQLLAISWRASPVQTTASFRGLAVAADGAIWVGGTRGTVIHSRDGGTIWAVDTVPGAGSFDFRGVAAIDADTAYLAISSQDSGRIYKTTDDGRSWTLQYRDERPGVFFDGIACWTEKRCLVVGDPIAGHFLVLTTVDGGAHWTPRDTVGAPDARAGEAAFAASNSTVIVGSGGRAWLATGGGPTARVWRTSDYALTWRVASTPIAAGSASAGIFSLAFCDVQHGVAVGGNYRMPDSTGAHVAISADGGETWILSDSARVTPYLSGVACVRADTTHPAFVAVGPTGTFATSDGRQWVRAAQNGFNAVAAFSTRRLIAVSEKGVVATADVSP
jgi:photosystem II stability/assembly factor-like uncharacterized protein